MKIYPREMRPRARSGTDVAGAVKGLLLQEYFLNAYALALLKRELGGEDFRALPRELIRVAATDAGRHSS